MLLCLPSKNQVSDPIKILKCINRRLGGKGAGKVCASLETTSFPPPLPALPSFLPPSPPLPPVPACNHLNSKVRILKLKLPISTYYISFLLRRCCQAVFKSVANLEHLRQDCHSSLRRDNDMT